MVDTRFVDKYGVWIVNNEGRLYALIAIYYWVVVSILAWCSRSLERRLHIA